MELTPQTVEIPKKLPEIVRSMEVGQSVEITQGQRQNFYNRARMAFPSATFATRSMMKGKKKVVYLTRTA